MSYLETVFVSLATSGALSAAVLWAARLWISERLKQSLQHEYATQLESHKATLKAEMDLTLAEHQARLAAENAQSLERLRADLATEAARHKATQDVLLAERQAAITAKNAETVERLRADLQIAAAQRQLLYKHLHEREAEAIAETYENIIDMKEKCAMYVSIMETPAMGSKSDRRDALRAAFTKFKNRFRLHRLYLPRALADAVQSFEGELFRRARTFASYIEREVPGKDNTELWMDIDEWMEKEASALLDQLENEFRRRLGQEVPPGGGALAAPPDNSMQR